MYVMRSNIFNQNVESNFIKYLPRLQLSYRTDIYAIEINFSRSVVYNQRHSIMRS